MFDDVDRADAGLPPLRSKYVHRVGITVSHRQAPAAKTEKPHGTSPWLDRPRDGFTQSMAAESKRMSATKQGASVKGLPTAE